MYVNDACYRETVQAMEKRSVEGTENLDWLYENMPGYFFITMKNEVEALTNLVMGLRTLQSQQKITLLDLPKKLIIRPTRTCPVRSMTL